MKKIKNPKQLYLQKQSSNALLSKKNTRISCVYLSRNYGLLSFGNEAEEDEEEITEISMVYINITDFIFFVFNRNLNKKALEKVHMI